MDTLPWYDPVQTYEESDLTTTLYVRQNPWKKSENVFEGVWLSRAIHIPHAHSRSACIVYLENQQQFLEQASHYSRLVMAAPDWTIALVPNGGAGLLVRIRGDVTCGSLPTMAIASQMALRSECGHLFPEAGNICAACDSSVLEVLRITNVQRIQYHISSGHTIEPFYTLYRNVQILGRAAYHNQDGRRFARPASAGTQNLFWKRRDDGNPTNPPPNV
jgi:hypothetical protein